MVTSECGCAVKRRFMIPLESSPSRAFLHVPLRFWTRCPYTDTLQRHKTANWVKKLIPLRFEHFVPHAKLLKQVKPNSAKTDRILLSTHSILAKILVYQVQEDIWKLLTQDLAFTDDLIRLKIPSIAPKFSHGQAAKRLRPARHNKTPEICRAKNKISSKAEDKKRKPENKTTKTGEKKGGFMVGFWRLCFSRWAKNDKIKEVIMRL